MASARANNNYSVTTEETIYDPSSDGQAYGLRISCKSTSTSAVLITCQGMHGSTQFFELEAGESEVIWARSFVGLVRAKAQSGTATISWGVIAR